MPKDEKWVVAQALTPEQQTEILNAIEEFNDQRKEEKDPLLKRQEAVDFIVKQLDEYYE